MMNEQHGVGGKRFAANLMDMFIHLINKDEYDSELAKLLGVGSLSRRERQLLKGLSDKDKESLIKGGYRFIKVDLNRSNIGATLSVIAESKKKEQLIDDLVLENATQSMMYDLFGISPGEMAQLRRKHGIKHSGGRPSELSDHDITLLYAAYSLEVADLNHGKSVDAVPKMCLRISRNTMLPISSVFNFIKEMNQHG